MSEMENYLPQREYEETAKRCLDALRNGNYEEAMKLVDQLYKLDFNRMNHLLCIKRELQERHPHYQARTLDETIKSTQESLDFLLNVGIRVAERQGEH